MTQCPREFVTTREVFHDWLMRSVQAPPSWQCRCRERQLGGFDQVKRRTGSGTAWRCTCQAGQRWRGVARDALKSRLRVRYHGQEARQGSSDGEGPRVGTEGDQVLPGTQMRAPMMMWAGSGMGQRAKVRGDRIAGGCPASSAK